MKKVDVSEVYFGQYAVDYDKRRTNSKNWRMEQAAVLPELSAIRAGERVLDIPGGTGRWLEALQKLGAVPILFDVSDEMLSIARQKAEALSYPIETVVGNALTERYPAADWLISNRFFNKVSLDDVRKVLESAKRAGVRGFIFTVRIREDDAPLIADLLQRLNERWRRLRRRIKRGFRTKGGHVHREADFRRMIAECGLTVERSVVCDHYPGRRKILMRLSM